LQKKTLSKSVASVRSLATSNWSGISYRFEQWINSSACAWIAFTSAGWLWPKELVAIPAMKSR
jgi:hypothetical protein